MQQISNIALLVRDYDEAISFFTRVLRFELTEDRAMGPQKRWVTVRPSGGGTSLVLAKAASPDQLSRLGDQTGGRVFLFLQTDSFWEDYHHMKYCGVQFAEEPREEAYGTVVVFLDLYGNRWDLMQLRDTVPKSS